MFPQRENGNNNWFEIFGIYLGIFGSFELKLGDDKMFPLWAKKGVRYSNSDPDQEGT